MVALRKESVDRNIEFRKLLYPGAIVALRKESVDRNVDPDKDSLTDDVALRKESVDRNGLGFCHYRDDVVALRKESVDRNDVIRPAIDVFLGRSPQGERG